jgi:hypothetical protein
MTKAIKLSNIRAKEISKWKELEEILGKKSRSDSIWVFRGQSCATWGLETKLQRKVLD